MHQKLLKEIAMREELTDLDVLLCKQYLEPVYYPSNEIVIETDKVPQYLYYIVSGFMRLFYYDDRGNEVTIHLNCPYGFFTSYPEFYNQSPSSVIGQCISDCRLLRISKCNVDALMQESIAWRNYSDFVQAASLAYNDERTKDLATLTAEERYLKLMTTNPEFIQNIPLQYIASFLGMKPESLSRIRRNVIT